MEPNTSSFRTAWTSPAAVLEHGEPSVDDPSLLSHAFSHAPSPGLLPMSRSGSELSWYQQIPPSLAVPAGNGSLSVHVHAASSQPLPSYFPTTSTLPMVGYDLFGNLEAAAVTSLPTLLGGQWEQGESSSKAAPILPERLSMGLFWFACESTAWPSKEMSMSFLSPSSACGLVPQSNDRVGFLQPSSDSELEALLQSFRIPPQAVKESPIDPLLPNEKEDDIDVSVFLASNPQDQLPNASLTASPQMADNYGEASASWMALGSTGNTWPPMLAPAAATTCTMVSTSSGSMASHTVGSSIGLTSSIGGMMKPTSFVLPLVPPSSQGSSASSSNFSGFAQPSLSSVLAPLVPNLHGPLLPVKEEVMESRSCMEYVDAAPCRHPASFISLVDEEDGYNVFGSWGSSSPASFAPGSWLGSSSGNPSFAPGSWGGGSSSLSFAPSSWSGGSSSLSFAPSSWSGSSSGSPSFPPSSWSGRSSSRRSFAPGRWGSNSSPSFAPGRWGSNSSNPSFAGSTPCFDRSTSIDIYSSSSMTNLCIGGKMSSTSDDLPPLPRAGASSNKANGGTGIVFTDREKAIIAKDKKLQELLRTYPKKVKRILYNREYSATAKVCKVIQTKNLERLVVTLEERRKSLCAELQSLEEGSAALMQQKMEMQMIIGELEQQTRLKDAVREGLRAEI